MPLPLRDHHAFLPPFSLSPLPARSLSLVLPEDHGWREATFRQREEFDRKIDHKKMNLDVIAIPSKEMNEVRVFADQIEVVFHFKGNEGRRRATDARPLSVPSFLFKQVFR